MGDDFFLPVAVIDVTLATWRRDALTCLGRWGCRAFKLVPNYHEYDLSHPRVADLVDLAEDVQVPVCIQVRMMDERGHHALMKVPGVSLEQLVPLARRHPDARFLVCGAYYRELASLADATNVWAEISLVERERPLKIAVDTEPGDVDPEVVQAVRKDNAAALLGGA